METKPTLVIENDDCVANIKQIGIIWVDKALEGELTFTKPGSISHLFKEATKGKGMRTLFRKAGFQTYLVDEFRTSCRCSKCEIGICKKTMVRENPKPYRSGNVLIH
jgi:hypothetical protein